MAVSTQTPAATNNDPTLTLPPLEQVTPSSTTSIAGISYSDSFAASNPGDLFLAISDKSGALSASDSLGTVNGSGTNSIAFSGPYSDIAAALNSLAYSAPAPPGSDTINFDIWDQAGIQTTGFIPVSIASGDGGNWVETWAASSEPPVLGTGDPGLIAPSFDDQTVREVIRISAGGDALRLGFSNKFRDSPLLIGAVHVALYNGNGTIVPGTDHAVTFGGQTSITLSPDTTAESDPLNFSLSPNTDLAVSIYLPGNTGPVTWNQFGDTSPIVTGDQAGVVTLPGENTIISRPILSSVDVNGGGTDGSIIVLGDSISVVEPDLDQNDRWTDDLSQRLQASPGSSNLAVVNAGISGNRVLADGTGPSAISRFANDVVSAPGARYVVVEEGVNDIGAGSSAQDIENGYIQLITIAHAAGLQILGTTLTPIGGSFYDTPEHEAVRDAINNWIRTSGAFDAVVDFDAAVHDPQNPQWWLPAYDNGSHLHPSGAGAAAMANAVDLQLFAPSPGGGVPTLTEPSSETVAAGATQSVRGSYSDPFAAGNPGLLYLSVSDSSGTLSATDLSGNLATGSGTSNIAVSAPYSAVNAILASLTYTAGSKGGSDGIAFDIWNQAGVETTAAVQVTVTTIGGGGGPTLNVPPNETVLPGSTLERFHPDSPYPACLR